MRRMDTMARRVLSATLLLCATAPAAYAGVSPQLIVDGGSGVAAGTVAVTVTLANDDANTAGSADVDFTYPVDQVEFTPPVVQRCTIAGRLATTHQVGGTLVNPGLLRLNIFYQPTVVERGPLGNGELVSCDFRILDGVPPGTAPLEISFASLFDPDGGQLSVEPVGGDIEIVAELPTSTPTETSTPEVTGTPTDTGTPEVTGTPTDTETPEVTGTPTDTETPEVTVTPTNTPTREVTSTRTNTPTPEVTGTPTDTETPEVTRTSTATRTRTHAPSSAGDDGCNVVPPGQSSGGGTLALMLAPALLIWVRRRRF